jgi:uncharacterized membrane protein
VLAGAVNKHALKATVKHRNITVKINRKESCYSFKGTDSALDFSVFGRRITFLYFYRVQSCSAFVRLWIVRPCLAWDPTVYILGVR